MKSRGRELEARAKVLRERLEKEEETRGKIREEGRNALSMADSILQSVEQSLEYDAGAMSARQPRRQPSGNLFLPKIERPDTAEV